MDEKRFYCDERGEYRSYAIYDCSKVEKTKEDFWNSEEEIYDIFAYTDYLLENDCMIISDEVENLLNKFAKENEQLKHYKLYEDNKRLQTIIADLKEENEQLKQEVIVYKKAFQKQVQRCSL